MGSIANTPTEVLFGKRRNLGYKQYFVKKVILLECFGEILLGKIVTLAKISSIYLIIDIKEIHLKHIELIPRIQL